jgi:VanZ family protein
MIQHTKKLLEAKTLLFLGVLYTFIITYLFVAPKPDLPEIDFFISMDKIGHFLIHVILSFIWLAYFFVRGNYVLTIRYVFLIAFVCIIYGIVIEVFQQMLLANRKADLSDILANSIGTLVGMLLFLNVKKRMIF